MAQLFRLYTEDKNREQVLSIVSARFPGFTVHEGIGFWKGTQEKTLIIEVYHAEVLPTPDGVRINTISGGLPDLITVADGIKALNGQESVLIVSLNCSGVLV